MSIFFRTFAYAKYAFKKMEAKKILYINTEMSPFVPDTTMAKRFRQLPQAIQESGCEIRTFMPKWGIINERRNQLHEVIRLSGMNIIINSADHSLLIKVASIQPARMQIYFIDNDEYFRKKGMGKDLKGKDYANNGERAVFYARGVLETVKKLGWIPDVVHCSGWVSAIAPLLIRTSYADEPAFMNTKIVYSATQPMLEKNMGKTFPKSLFYKTTSEENVADIISPNTTFDDLQKMALKFSDGLILEDENVSQEVVDYAKSLGLPVLGVQPLEGCKAAYAEFYNKVL